MSNAILDALPDEPVLQSNSLATVTPTCVIVRMPRGHSQTVVAIASVGDVRRVKTTYPGLLVISAALFLIAAGAYSSKQGANAAIPMAVFGLAFLIFYVGSRRASVVFATDEGSIETVQGTFREAAALVQAVRKARRTVAPEWSARCGRGESPAMGVDQRKEPGSSVPGSLNSSL